MGGHRRKTTVTLLHDTVLLPHPPVGTPHYTWWFLFLLLFLSFLFGKQIKFRVSLGSVKSYLETAKSSHEGQRLRQNDLSELFLLTVVGKSIIFKAVWQVTRRGERSNRWHDCLSLKVTGCGDGCSEEMDALTTFPICNRKPALSDQKLTLLRTPYLQGVHSQVRSPSALKSFHTLDGRKQWSCSS